MTKGANLYRLQCLDDEGDGKRRRLAEVETALGEDEVLKQARRAVESAQARVKKRAAGQRDLELETQGLVDKSVHEEKRLYSGAIKNPKELQELQAEVAALKRRRGQLEEALLAGPAAAGYATDLWTGPRIRKLIWDRFRVRYHRGHVWLLLRKLGWSCEKPAQRAVERDEETIATWLRQRWPRIKRGR